MNMKKVIMKVIGAFPYKPEIPWGYPNVYFSKVLSLSVALSQSPFVGGSHLLTDGNQYKSSPNNKTRFDMVMYILKRKLKLHF